MLRRTSEEGVIFTLQMEPELLAFQGHFPGQPILPGVVQMDWAVQLGTAAFGDLGRFDGIHQLKFQGVIRPGETVELSLQVDADHRRLRFAYAVGAERRSAGTVLFSPRP